MIERRKHKRYSMPRGTFAILRNELDPLANYRRMSIGEIAMVLYKSESRMLGQVANMSYGGIAFENSCYHVPASNNMELDLLMAEQGLYLHNIPFQLPPKSLNVKIRKRTNCSPRAVLRFKKLDPKLKNKLRELMAHHTG